MCCHAHLSDARSNISTASTFVSLRRAAAPAHAECTSGKMTNADFCSKFGTSISLPATYEVHVFQPSC